MSSIISHRGASGYLPEHSLPAYRLAIDLGSNYIEPDLVLSKDGVFFCLHDILLDETTNINLFPEFQSRRRTQLVDGYNVTGFFAHDFLSDELKSLRVKQRLPLHRSTITDFLFEIPSLQDVFTLVQHDNRSGNRTVGLYLELKHPSYYYDLGFHMADLLLDAVKNAGYNIFGCDSDLIGRSEALPIVIQCFESFTLKYLRLNCDLPLVQLTELHENQTIGEIWSNSQLDEVKSYANGLGPPLKFFTLPLSTTTVSQRLIKQAHAHGLAVHPWQLRAEAEFVSPQFNGSTEQESLYFICCLGVDGIFTEFPDQTRQYVRDFRHDPDICSYLCPVDRQSFAVADRAVTHKFTYMLPLVGVSLFTILISIFLWQNFTRNSRRNASDSTGESAPSAIATQRFELVPSDISPSHTHSKP